MTAERDGARRLVAAMRFQERALRTLDSGLDQLSEGEQLVLDACVQAHLDQLGEVRREQLALAQLQLDQTGPHRTHCSECGWASAAYPTRDLAGSRGTWHVFEEHLETYQQLFGDRPPADPDPRLAGYGELG